MHSWFAKYTTLKIPNYSFWIRLVSISFFIAEKHGFASLVLVRDESDFRHHEFSRDFPRPLSEDLEAMGYSKVSRDMILFNYRTLRTCFFHSCREPR